MIITTKSQMFDYIRRWEKSGQRQIDFCIQEGLSLSRFAHWRGVYLKERSEQSCTPSTGGSFYPLEDDKALPVISNTKMNEYLKELGEIAKIDEPQRIVYFKGNERFEEVYPKYNLLTTHCGRRTFIVNALYLVSAEVIMKWTGHSDYGAMKPYIKIVDALKANEMDKFNR